MALSFLREHAHCLENAGAAFPPSIETFKRALQHIDGLLDENHDLRACTCSPNPYTRPAPREPDGMPLNMDAFKSHQPPPDLNCMVHFCICETKPSKVQYSSPLTCGTCQKPLGYHDVPNKWDLPRPKPKGPPRACEEDHFCRKCEKVEAECYVINEDHDDIGYECRACGHHWAVDGPDA
jgi:hypothetical protein